MQQAQQATIDSSADTPSSLFDDRPPVDNAAAHHDIPIDDQLKDDTANTAPALTNASEPTQLAARGTKRGRKPQDPNQVIVRAACPAQQDFERQLRAFLRDDTIDRNHVLFEGTFPVSAAFLVDYGAAASGKAKSNSYKYGPAFAPGLGTNNDGHFARSMSVMEALAVNPDDPKERMRKQRAIARAVENLVERTDGFRYAFHNEWLARDNDAYRFSYFCNDSLLNKDRTLGGNKKNDSGKVKRARKQVYDCQGYLTVKFSNTRQCLDVLYKHIPLHMTYDERAPLPRVGTKRFQILEMTNPDHELVRRAREVEARKRIATGGGAVELQQRSSSEGNTPDPKRKRLEPSNPQSASDTPDSARQFHFYNHTVANEAAKRSSSGPVPLLTQTKMATDAASVDGGEVAELKARLAQAEMQIQRLQQTQSSPPPGFALAQPPYWYPPYAGMAPAPPIPPAPQIPSSSSNPATPTPGPGTFSSRGQNQLSVRRSQGGGSGEGAATSGQPLFQVMSFRPEGKKKRASAVKKNADGKQPDDDADNAT